MMGWIMLPTSFSVALCVLFNYSPRKYSCIRLRSCTFRTDLGHKFVTGCISIPWGNGLDMSAPQSTRHMPDIWNVIREESG